MWLTKHLYGIFIQAWSSYMDKVKSETEISSYFRYTNGELELLKSEYDIGMNLFLLFVRLCTTIKLVYSQ